MWLDDFNRIVLLELEAELLQFLAAQLDRFTDIKLHQSISFIRSLILYISLYPRRNLRLCICLHVRLIADMYLFVVLSLDLHSKLCLSLCLLLCLCLRLCLRLCLHLCLRLCPCLCPLCPCLCPLFKCNF